MIMSFKSWFFQASILVVLLFTTPSFANLDVNDSSKLINDICPTTRFPSYCLEVLESIPEAATADLKGLAQITLDLAISKASSTLDRIRSLIPQTTDPKLKQAYKSCSEHYDNTIGDLKEAESDFKQGDKYGMNQYASAAMTEAGDCDDQTEELAVDPWIQKGNQDFDNICGIVLAISNHL
ncbi:hypothetical protein ACOSP7_007103 [Xanthoceras sorbifolium]|uniref:Pectinesterase inhibitor domain-containing protein n=1 Tax=Xanthoceras sorbifolium TaxID=99658 RepID=A0ABQ8I9W1_9ROSI|nr:hypothetical protein JRO89_XS03G0147800 [Xanthoceras sorbifolium]